MRFAALLPGRAPGGAERLPREVWTLVAVSFLVAVGFGLVAPALPAFARSFDVSVTAASVVVSAFAFMRLAFAPVGGRLTTVLGEWRVHLIGLLVVAASTGACALAESYWQLLVLRSLGGIGSTMFTVATIALLVRVTPPALRGRSTGLWATGFLLGNVTGPLVGGGLIGISLRAPFVAYALGLVIAATVSWLMLRRSTYAGAEEPGTVAAMTVREAIGHSPYRAALLSNFANGWAVFGVRVSLVPLFVVEVLHRSESLAGVSLSVFAAGNVAILLFSGRIADSIGRRPPMLVGLLVAGAATVWLGFTDDVTMFMIACLVAGIGTGAITPAQSAVVADVIGSQRKGGPVLATFQMAADIGAIIGPVAAGMLADRFSYTVAFVVTGGIALAAVLPWLGTPETLPRPEDHTAEDMAAECGCLDEGPDPPTGERLSTPTPGPEQSRP